MTEAEAVSRLEAPEEAGVRLRYPEYWDAGSTEQARIAYADAEFGEARLWAARGLRGSRNPEALRAFHTAPPPVGAGPYRFGSTLAVALSNAIAASPCRPFAA